MSILLYKKINHFLGKINYNLLLLKIQNINLTIKNIYFSLDRVDYN